MDSAPTEPADNIEKIRRKFTQYLNNDLPDVGRAMEVYIHVDSKCESFKECTVRMTPHECFAIRFHPIDKIHGSLLHSLVSTFFWLKNVVVVPMIGVQGVRSYELIVEVFYSSIATLFHKMPVFVPAAAVSRPFIITEQAFMRGVDPKATRWQPAEWNPFRVNLSSIGNALCNISATPPILKIDLLYHRTEDGQQLYGLKVHGLHELTYAFVEYVDSLLGHEFLWHFRFVRDKELNKLFFVIMMTQRPIGSTALAIDEYPIAGDAYRHTYASRVTGLLAADHSADSVHSERPSKKQRMTSNSNNAGAPASPTEDIGNNSVQAPGTAQVIMNVYSQPGNQSSATAVL